MPKPLPFIGAAFVCERIIREKDDVLTAMRIVDTFYVDVENLQNLAKDTTPVAQLTALISVRAGSALGDSEIRVSLRRPDGSVRAIDQGFPVSLSAPESGANVIVTMGVAANVLGLHWIDVLWNGQPLTSIPFRLLPKGEQTPGADTSGLSQT
jgi:hypothetical protein